MYNKHNPYDTQSVEEYCYDYDTIDTHCVYDMNFWNMNERGLSMQGL